MPAWLCGIMRLLRREARMRNKMSNPTTPHQALDAMPAFKSYCESCGAICGSERAEPVSDIAGVDFSISWPISSVGENSIHLGMAVIGLFEGSVASASFESSNRAAAAKFVAGPGCSKSEQACQAERELAEAFSLWPRHAALAEREWRAELADKLAQRRSPSRQDSPAAPTH